MQQAGTAKAHRKRRFAMARSVFALVLREMSTTYGRSPGGYIWAILEPVAAIALFSLAFSFMVRHPPLGRSFALFYASGFLPLAAYQALAANVGGAIRFSKPLLAYPTVTYIDAIVARVFLTMLTHTLVFIIVLTGALMLARDPASLDFVALLRMGAMILVLGTSVGVMNCFLMSMFPIWQFIWAVLNRPMFLVSGVLFLIDELPETIRDLLYLNPVAHIVAMARVAVYGTYDGVFISEPYVYGLSLVLAAMGMVLLHRFHRTILNERV